MPQDSVLCRLGSQICLCVYQILYQNVSSLFRILSCKKQDVESINVYLSWENQKVRGDNQRFIQFCVKLSPLELLVPINRFFLSRCGRGDKQVRMFNHQISRSADVETAVLHVGVFDKMLNWKGFLSWIFYVYHGIFDS